MSRIDSWDSEFLPLFIIGFLCVALFVFSFVGCQVDKNEATKILQSQGYTNIKISGTNMFACGKGDVKSSVFIANGVNGNYTKGVVCCGLAKGCTVRITDVK